jgi:cation:H+ antiporter
MILTIFLFLIGFVFLIKGADLLVDGASSIARKMGISTLVIGLTIVSFGTSAPELIVSILANIQGKADIAIGNVLGSNIANILLILGVSASIKPIFVKRSTIWKEIPFSLLAIVVLALMANDNIIDGANYSSITRIDGLVLLAFLIIFLYYVFGISKIDKNSSDFTQLPSHSLLRSILYIIIGLAGLAIGGRWIVNGAIAIATELGINEGVVALTIVAGGTSLPELATSVVAARKGNVDIVVGNAIGSNILNIFLVLAISAVITPLPFSSNLIFDVSAVIFITLLLFMFTFIGNNQNILKRWQGILFICFYVVYIISLLIRA